MRGGPSARAERRGPSPGSRTERPAWPGRSSTSARGPRTMLASGRRPQRVPPVLLFVARGGRSRTAERRLPYRLRPVLGPPPLAHRIGARIRPYPFALVSESGSAGMTRRPGPDSGRARRSMPSRAATQWSSGVRRSRASARRGRSRSTSASWPEPKPEGDRTSSKTMA